MLLQKNKKIILYLFLFLIIGTLNNRNLTNENFLKDININVTGLDEISNIELINSLNLLEMNNLFFLDEKKIKKILNSKKKLYSNKMTHDNSPKNRKPNMEKSLNYTNMKHNFEDGLIKTVSWYKNFYKK